MKRSVLLLIALLLTGLLAGCNEPTNTSEPTPAEIEEQAAIEAAAAENETEAAPALPEDLQVPGTTLVSNDGTTAVFTYENEAPRQTGIWVQMVGAVQLSDIIDTLEVPVLEGLQVQVNLSLAWDSHMDMDLYLYDSAGKELCASENGLGATNAALAPTGVVESVEACGYAMESPLATPDLWKVDMEVFHNDNDGEPYRLTVTYRLL